MRPFDYVIVGAEPGLGMRTRYNRLLSGILWVDVPVGRGGVADDTNPLITMPGGIGELLGDPNTVMALSDGARSGRPSRVAATGCETMTLGRSSVGDTA